MKNVIVIPALQPDIILIDYINELIEKNLGDIVVVNDGSSKDRDYIFNEIRRIDKCAVIEHDINKGKGAAIKTAVKYIINNIPDADSIITVDADGQHASCDVESVYKLLMKENNALVLGVREFDTETPFKSKIGNIVSAKALKLLYNIDLRDTQTGLRGIGRKYFEWLLDLPGDRYEYELNMLIYTKKLDLDIKTVKIQTLYFDGNSGSHFRAIKDSARIFFQLFKGLGIYMSNSLISALCDIGTFSLLIFFTQNYMSSWLSIAISATIARIVSSSIDFSLNRNYFCGRKKDIKGSLIRYYTLWVIQLMTSIGLVNYVVGLLPGSKVLYKVIVDIVLAAVSYQVQLRWVFKNRDLGNEKGILYKCFRYVGRLFTEKRLVGYSISSEEAVLVGHHQNLYGPCMAALYLPDTIQIWALSDFLEFKTCFKQYYGYTFTKRAGLPKFIAAPIAVVAASFVPALMKSARVIPVYRKSERIKETFDRSIEALKRGSQLMIFPDIYYDDNSPIMREIYTGFLNIDQLYFNKEKKHINFIPVCFHKYTDYISVGEHIRFMDEDWCGHSKHNLAGDIIRSINKQNDCGPLILNGSNMEMTNIVCMD